MRSIHLILCLGLLLPVSSIHLRDDPDDDASVEEANEAVQEANAGVPPRPPAQEVKAVPSAVSMVGSLDRFGAKAKKELKSFGGSYHAAAPAPAAAAPILAVKAPDVSEKEAAKKAHVAVEVAKDAASVANKIAKNSVHLADNAKESLQKAHDALHNARANSKGLSKKQKKSLKKAEAKLREATKKAEYGQIKNAKYVDAKVENKRLQKLEKKMDNIKMEESKSNDDELEAMRKEIKELRKDLKKKEGEKDDNDSLLKDLQDEIEAMEATEKKSNHKDKKSHDEMKAEIERLRTQIKNMEDEPEVAKVEVVIPPMPEKAAPKPVTVALPKEEEKEEEEVQEQATPVEEKGIDIDTAMPYGDLEPFGREDTAQELTESSIKESDGMVDQLERAEVAEEKRAVFRALTRLRGAAITSFDGVARSQTGNIDEYNKVHKWRNAHPLHHLADEESDVSKWAFPDNADF